MGLRIAWGKGCGSMLIDFEPIGVRPKQVKKMKKGFNCFRKVRQEDKEPP
jgi:hypothetical protein